MGRRTRWTPVLASVSVVLSAAIGVVINVATDSARLTVVVAAAVLVLIAAGLAWLDGKVQLTPDTAGVIPVVSGYPARAATGLTLSIRYAIAERRWASWIRAELAPHGVDVRLEELVTGVNDDDPGQPGISGEAARRPLIIASQTADEPRRLLVRVDDTPLPAPEANVLDLAGLPEYRARETLLAEVAVLLGVRLAPGPAASGNPIPYPGTLPRVWSVPPRNPAFIGREAVLFSLRRRLAAGPTVVVPEALYGLGGVGKTQTAIEYAHRFATDYDLIWWISAEDPRQARLALASLAIRLGIPEGDGATDSAAAVLDMLRQGRPYARWLLIYDNAEDPVELLGLIPQGAGHVLITSRSHAWARVASAVEMSVFDRAESVALLHRRVPDLPESHARAVADKLGDLPLAIEQAGAWLATSAMPVHRYLDLLDSQPMRTLDDSPPSSYGRAVSATWLLSLERLRTTSPAAAALLDLCACFAPEPIPLDQLFRSDRCLSALAEADPGIRDPMLQARVVRDIGQSALARVNPTRSTLQIHRLVRAVIGTALGMERRKHYGRLMLRILGELNPRNPEDHAKAQIYADLWPHLSAADLAGIPTDDDRALVTDMTRYLWYRGDYRSSQELAETALARWQSELGHADRTVLLLRIYLGNAMRGQTNHAGAYECDAAAYTDAKLTYGEHDRLTLHAANSLTADLRIRGDHRMGHKMDSRTVANCREVLDDDDPLLLMSMNNLGVSLRWVGDFKAAAALDQYTLERYRAAFGPDHLRSLTAANNYATDLRWLGDVNGSYALLENSLTASLRSMGTNNANRLLLAANLAVTLRRLGLHRKAHTLTLDTLARGEKHLGPNHRHTLASRVNLACEQSALGEHAAAHRTATGTLAQYEALFGEDHPLSLVSANNLVVILCRLNDLPAALAAADQVADRIRDSLGGDHPYTLGSMINLANAAYAIGATRRARDTDEETYARSTAILGESHYLTLNAAANLATSRHRTGDRRAARTLRVQAASTSDSVLGDQHPIAKVIRSRGRLGFDLEPPTI